MTDTLPIVVTDRPEEARYEARIHGVLAGIAEYEPEEDRLVFVHTEVLDAFEGRGVGGALARGALDDVRQRGLGAVIECPFIRRWIARHPEYSDLVAQR